MRVTDLEKFSFEHIWRPFWPMRAEAVAAGWKLGAPATRLTRAPYNLSETACLLREPSEWRDDVIARIARIGVTFPEYIRHPLVDVVLELIAEHRSRPEPVTGLMTLQFGNGEFRGVKLSPREVHLVRCNHRGGTPGPTLCGVDRFAQDCPGWSVGGGHGYPGGQTACAGCIETAHAEFPGLVPEGCIGRDVARAALAVATSGGGSSD